MRKCIIGFNYGNSQKKVVIPAKAGIQRLIL